MESLNKLICPIGTKDGAPVFADVKKLPHLLIAGGEAGVARRYLYDLLLSLIKEKDPNTLRLLVIFMPEIPTEIPHLLADPINDTSKATNAFLWATEETDRRYELIVKAGFRSIDDYNATAEEKLPYVLIACGSLEKLDKKAQEKAAIIAARSRAAGIFLTVCAEQCDPKVVSGILKANIPSRIAFKTAEKRESRVILDMNGAEALNGNELLFLPVGCNRPELLTFEPFDRKEASAILADAKKHPAPPRTKITPKSDTVPIFCRALRIAVEKNGITTALLQRSLGIGYAKAARLMEEMEKAGYIGEYEGSKPRAVLIAKEQLEEIEKEIL